MMSSILLMLLYVIRPTLQLESDTFLIYNENHKKCLQAQQDTVMVADCKEDNDGQKFRWISKHQLINVQVSQCLGVSSKSELSMVSLSSCDGANELQKWECKNDTLFGIQGEDLYLNYGNAKEKVIIHKQSKDWSRWKIYGTPDDLCVKAYEDIYSLLGNGQGQPCVFPFKFKLKWYADCTRDGTKHADLWCATTMDYDKDELWGYCPVKSTREGWWTTDSITGSRYQVNGNAALTWYQARRSCHQQDAELLSVTEIHQQTYILGLTHTTQTELWIGLHSLDLNAGWKWNDGNPFRFLNWLPGNPSPEHAKNCVSMNSKNSGKWENKECSKRLGYICKKGNITSYNPPSGTGDFVCPPMWNANGDSCVFLYKEPKSWQEAMASCRAEKGDLVSVHNVEEANVGNSCFGIGEPGLVWLGLNDLKTQMFFEWSDGTPVTYTSWQRGEPSHYDNRQEDCVALNTTLCRWEDHTCEEKLPYFCKVKALPRDGERGPIELGCTLGWKRHGLHCYFVGETAYVFAEANFACHHQDAFLLTVGDRFEQAYITSLIGLRPEMHFWTGLSDLEERGTFKWNSSEKVLYTHWDANMPGRKHGCVALRTGNKGGLWDVINCDEKAKYVCKKLAQGVTLPTTAIPTTTPELKCPPEWKTRAGISSCYRLYKKPEGWRKSWFEARDFCRAIGGDLLSVNNIEEEMFVSTMLNDEPYNEIWMGLVNTDPDEGFEWSDNSPLVYENWQYGEPNNWQGVELCGEIKTGHSILWNDRNCEQQRDWICELKKGATLLPEPTGLPDSGFNLTDDGWLVKGDKQYYVSDNEVTMDKARAFCRSNSGDLVTIHDEEERKFLWQFILRKKTKDAYYIGLHLSVDKQFIWMDGSPVDYVAWSVNEPNFSNNDENCVELYRDLGLWNDVNCGTLTSYICERETKNINTTFAPTSSVPQGGCPAEWLELKGKCYRIFGKEGDDLVDWHTGRSACHNLKANLASIHDDLTQAFLTFYLRDFKNPVWIGLNDISWKRKYRWTDQSGVYYTKWANGHPSAGFYAVGQKTPDCVAIKVGEKRDAGSWTTELCNQEKGYICQKPSDPNLPVLTTQTPAQYEFGDASYKFQKTKMKWDEARKMCKQSDYDLVSVVDEYTNSFITLQLDISKEPMWIGLYSNNKTGNQYKWSDGWRLRYTKWAPEEPKEKSSCVYIDVNGQWKTASCDENYASICKQSSVVAPTEPPQKPGSCPESSSKNWIPFRSHCYYMEVTWFQWGQASIDCLRHGGTLVSVEDHLEADFLSHHVELASDKRTHFWIGLYKNVKGEWLWLDNTPVDYVNWSDGEPTDHDEDVCIAIDAKKGTWVSRQCYRSVGYICKTQKIPESPVNTQKPEMINDKNKPARGMAAGVAILVIVLIAGTVIAVFLLYRKRHSRGPSIENNYGNPLFFSDNHTTQDTNILVNNME